MTRYISRIVYGAAILLGLLFFNQELKAQETPGYADTLGTADEVSVQDSFSMEGELELRTGANLDSLLNLWYVNQSLESATDDYLAEADTLIPDFSDSVYMQRLAEIPTIFPVLRRSLISMGYPTKSNTSRLLSLP